MTNSVNQVTSIDVPVDVGDANYGLFNSPITTYNGNIYVAFVGNNEDGTKSTQVGKYNETDGWTFSVVETANLRDLFHAQPSIAVDTDGFIHVVYNMHTSPWQYSVSTKAEDITSFEFMGQDITGDKAILASHDIHGPGTGMIPGNRITYPYLIADREGQLFISYRDARRLEDKIDFGDRQWSLSISKYDVKTKLWTRVGKKDTVLPFATEPGYVPLIGHIAFDTNNRMHVCWNWLVAYNRGGTGELSQAGYAYSDDKGDTFKRADGTDLFTPIRLHPSDKVNASDYYSIYPRIAATSDGTPYIMFETIAPSTAVRSFVYYDKVTGWSDTIKAPFGARHLIIANNDSVLPISSGVKVHKSSNDFATWRNIDVGDQDSGNFLWIDNSYSNSIGDLRVLTQNKNTGKMTVRTMPAIS